MGKSIDFAEMVMYSRMAFLVLRRHPDDQLNSRELGWRRKRLLDWLSGRPCRVVDHGPDATYADDQVDQNVPATGADSL